MSRFAVLLLLGAIVLLVLGAFAPVVPMIWSERQLSKDVAEFSLNPEFKRVSEVVLRSKLQEIARKRGFHLEFEDIVVGYRDGAEREAMPVPVELGYTLSMALPVFGFFPLRVVTIRNHPMSGVSGL